MNVQLHSLFVSISDNNRFIFVLCIKNDDEIAQDGEADQPSLHFQHVGFEAHTYWTK